MSDGKGKDDEQRDALVLHDPDPASLSTVARAQPYIVLIRKPYFEEAIRSQTEWIYKFGLKPVA